MTSRKQYIDLKLPSIMGMGAVGPTLAMLTAALYGGLAAAMAEPPAWVYPVIMLVLSGLLAVFPVSQTSYPRWQRYCLWPVTLAIIFSTAWGTNQGLSVGEDALSRMPPIQGIDFSLIPSAYAGSDDFTSSNVGMFKDAIFNHVPFRRVELELRTEIPQNPFRDLDEGIWGIHWGTSLQVYLKDKNGVWWGYRLREEKPQPPPAQSTLKGGFFKRF